MKHQKSYCDHCAVESYTGDVQFKVRDRSVENYDLCETCINKLNKFFSVGYCHYCKKISVVDTKHENPFIIHYCRKGCTSRCKGCGKLVNELSVYHECSDCRH